MSSIVNSNSVNFEVMKYENKQDAYLNNVSLSADDIRNHDHCPRTYDKHIIKVIRSFTEPNKKDDMPVFLSATEYPQCKPGTIIFNRLQRDFLNTPLTKTLHIKFCCDQYSKIQKITSLVLVIGLSEQSNKKLAKETYLHDEFLEAISNSFDKFVLNLDQSLFFPCGEKKFVGKVMSINDPKDLTKVGLFDKMLLKDLQIKIEPSFSKFIEIENAPSSSIHMNFQGMGVGGLESQLREIMTRVFQSRQLPSETFKLYGVKHSKGVLLYGPPGTGKTLIARTIAEKFGVKEENIKIVNGPEVLNKFVGQSEENIRNLFFNAEEEQKAKGDKSSLHIIIIDEIDAICKSRGSTSGGSGVGDSIVNQLLTKIDGVKALNNILIIGMTNRKDLLDEALIRSGRIDIHLEITLPDETGRREIFEIQTRSLKENKLLDPSVNIHEWVKRTENFTGADIANLVQTASMEAITNYFDSSDQENLKLKAIDKKQLVPVTQADFEYAFKKVKPSYGIAQDKLAPYKQKKFVPYNENINHITKKISTFTKTLQTSKLTTILSTLILGNSGTGKTSLAVNLALNSGFPFIGMISSGTLAGKVDKERIDYIESEFRKAYQSPRSVMILDDLEGIISASPEMQMYSLQTVLKIKDLLKTNPPKDARMLIFVTSCADKTGLDRTGLYSSFTSVYRLNDIREKEVEMLVRGLELIPESAPIPKLSLPASIKSVIQQIEMNSASPEFELNDEKDSLDD